MSLQINDNIRKLGLAAQEAIAGQFAGIDAIAEENTFKVLSAFHKHRVSDSMFAGTTGYGYDDLGRETLGKIYAEIFKTEDGLVGTCFVNGTHAITSTLFGVLRPGDTLVSAIGAPYDTLLGVIGVTGNASGSLKEFGVNYHQVDLKSDDTPDLEGMVKAATLPGVKAMLIQRSRGYATRKSLSVDEIGNMISAVKTANPNLIVIVDNCYGEFVETREPTEVGADICVGSLIKNPGGGLAPMGGYVVGKHQYVEAASMRMTAPGIGRECGATLNQNRSMFQGLFMAPHVVAQAVKTAVFTAKIMSDIGYTPEPTHLDTRHDIIQMIHLRNPENVKSFCKGIQSGAPVDSHVTPEPWDMPGYECPVIMAAGAFIQGASIELSADAPMREPYTVYMQGGLTYESGKAGILLAVQELLKD